MRIVILGAGESGVGAALLAQQQGEEVFVSDYGKIADKYKTELTENNITFEENQHTEDLILNADVIIKSPGIPDKAPIIKKLLEKGVEIISEIEFASRYTSAFIIGITGSNGKTTTTNLVYHILKTAEKNVVMGGNIGYSFARLLTESKRDYYVLELSSFQLDGIKNFTPNIAILLNITPDHLDRYEYKLENYIASKFRISMNQQLQHYFIYNGKDSSCTAYKKTTNALQIPIYLQNDENYNVLIVNDIRYNMAATRLKGVHNFFNTACAITAAELVGISPQQIQAALITFINVPHRLEYVNTIDGVEYINDSKATNVDAVYYALQAMTKPVIWIVGGQDKGNDYVPLAKFVNQKVKAVVCMGVDNKKLKDTYCEQFGDNFFETKSADAAVHTAAKIAQHGDVVLLSPACASFDLFNNYEHRGELFKQAVNNLFKTV